MAREGFIIAKNGIIPVFHTQNNGVIPENRHQNDGKSPERPKRLRH